LFEHARCGDKAGDSFSGIRSGETKPQLLKRLLDDDAKPVDAHGESSDSSKGNENRSHNE
jgi:hypothetical protein